MDSESDAVSYSMRNPVQKTTTRRNLLVGGARP